MSVWSSFEGTVWVPKKCRHGIKDLIKIHFRDVQDCKVKVLLDGYESRLFHFQFSCPHDGYEVSGTIKTFLRSCEEHKMRVDMDANLRFMT